MSDLNLLVLNGRIAAPPEIRRFESGSCLLRYLIVAESSFPRHRSDLIPVSLWDPPAELLASPGEPGRRAMVIASLQRRYDDAGGGSRRRGRLEAVAAEIELAPERDG